MSTKRAAWVIVKDGDDGDRYWVDNSVGQGWRAVPDAASVYATKSEAQRAKIPEARSDVRIVSLEDARRDAESTPAEDTSTGADSDDTQPTGAVGGHTNGDADPPGGLTEFTPGRTDAVAAALAKAHTNHGGEPEQSVEPPSTEPDDPPSEAVDVTEEPTDGAPAPDEVEYAEEVPIVGDETWVIQQDSDGHITYWTPDGDNSLLIHHAVSMWPSKQAALDAVRAVHGKVPRSHTAVQLTDEQAEAVGSPYRVIQGELVSDDLPTTGFAGMELPELADAIRGWWRAGDARVVEANSVMSTATQAYMHLGEALLAAKARVKARGGLWEPWVEENFNKTVRSAQYYMLAYKKRNAVSFLDPNLSLRAALKQISGKRPDPPPPPEPKPHPGDAAAKAAALEAERKSKAINGATTLIADLQKQVAKELTRHTITADDADIINNKMILPLRQIAIDLAALAKTAFDEDDES